MLNLNECVSLRTVPNMRNSSLLEVLNLKGCVKLSALSQMSTLNVVIDVSKCWSLERIPILNDLDRLELDVTVGDIDGEVVDNVALSEPGLRLKLTCQRESSTFQRPGNVEMWKQRLQDRLWSEDEIQKRRLIKIRRSEDVEIRAQGLLKILRSEIVKKGKEDLTEMFESLVNIKDVSLGFSGRASEIENDFGLMHSCGDGVRHFKNMHGLLDSEEWMRRRSVFNRQTYVKFSSLAISCKRFTEFQCTMFFTIVSRLEFIKCRRLRCLSILNCLPALETLVISQCDELESLPDLRTSTALKHLTIQDFRQGPKFQFLSHLCQPLHAYPKIWTPCFDFRNLVELNFDGCVGLGGLEHWGTLPALESLVIKDCNTITQLPDLRRSSKLSKVIVMECGKFRKAVDVGFEEAFRVARIERCGNEKLTNISSREELCRELGNVLHESTHLRIMSGILDLIKWLEEGVRNCYHLDMFRELDFSKFQCTGPTLEAFNTLMAKWAQISSPSAPITSS